MAWHGIYSTDSLGRAVCLLEGMARSLQPYGEGVGGFTANLLDSMLCRALVEFVCQMLQGIHVGDDHAEFGSSCIMNLRSNRGE
jgi:hypothetical protein